MLTRPFFQHLASQGHVIVDLAYTRVPEVRLHGQVADVKRAIRWAKTDAGQYGVNPDRVVLMGASAGAHLALLTAYTAAHPVFQVDDVQGDMAVCAVVSYYGIARPETGLLPVAGPLQRSVLRQRSRCRLPVSCCPMGYAGDEMVACEG